MHISLATIYLLAKEITVGVGRVYIDRLSVGVDRVYMANKVSAKVGCMWTCYLLA